MRAIDADVLDDKAYELWVHQGSQLDVLVAGAIKDMIDTAPTLDVEPVRRGEWLPLVWSANELFCQGQTVYECSLCGRIEEENSEPYCHCGAKMR